MIYKSIEIDPVPEDKMHSREAPGQEPEYRETESLARNESCQREGAGSSSKKVKNNSGTVTGDKTHIRIMEVSQKHKLLPE
jgi:hypothetical protein